MLEGEFNRKLKQSLCAREELRAWAVIKHCNPYHKGVPDFSASFGKKTVWWEVKVAPNEPTQIQLYHLKKMDGFWLQASTDGRRAFIFPNVNIVLGYDELVDEIVRRCVS